MAPLSTSSTTLGAFDAGTRRRCSYRAQLLFARNEPVTWIAGAVTERRQRLVALGLRQIGRRATIDCALTCPKRSSTPYLRHVLQSHPLVRPALACGDCLARQGLASSRSRRLGERLRCPSTALRRGGHRRDRARTGAPRVMLHDYHLYLAPRMIRDARPEPLLQQFIHIPWPEPADLADCCRTRSSADLRRPAGERQRRLSRPRSSSRELPRLPA